MIHIDSLKDFSSDRNNGQVYTTTTMPFSVLCNTSRFDKDIKLKNNENNL
jgi:hypothetical protein